MNVNLLTYHPHFHGILSGQPTGVELYSGILLKTGIRAIPVQPIGNTGASGDVLCPVFRELLQEGFAIGYNLCLP